MSKAKVLITSSSVPRFAIDLLKNRFDVIVSKEAKQSRNDIKKEIQGVDGVFWASHEPFNSEILDAAGPKLKVIATLSVGVDHIDLAEIKNRRLKLGYTPEVLSDTVAETAILLALAAGRRLHEGRKHIERGTWIGGFDWMLGQDIYQSTCGIVGLGRIGQEIAKRVKCFQTKNLIYSGHKPKPQGDKLGAKFVSFEELLKISDFVFIACPLTPETKFMFNSKAFRMMKKNAVLINISRGLVIDQDALVEALLNGEIFAAGLDVMTPEPLPTNSKLLTLDNCVLMPHLGSATERTRDLMAKITAENIIAGLTNEKMPYQYLI